MQAYRCHQKIVSKFRIVILHVLYLHDNLYNNNNEVFLVPMRICIINNYNDKCSMNLIEMTFIISASRELLLPIII